MEDSSSQWPGYPGKGHAENAVYHEALHAMRANGLLRPAEWAALVRAAKAHPDIKAWVDDYRAWAPADYWTAQRLEEEPVAEYVARVLSGQIKPDTGTPASRAVEKIRVVLRALASALRGQGFTTAAEVIDKIRKGEIAGRFRQEPTLGTPGVSAPPTLSDWGRRLLDGLRSGATGMVEIGDVPEILRAFGGRGKSLTMSLGKVRRIMREHPDVPAQTMVALPDLIANPVFVLWNQGDNRSGDLLLVTDAETAKGDVIVAAVKRAGTDQAGARATVVVTVYDKQDISGMLGRAESAGNILYVRAEREGDGYRHTGANSLNASLSDTIKRLRVSSKIRTPRSIFKRFSFSPPRAAFSRAAQDRGAAANAASDAPKETLALAPETRRQELWRRLKDDKNRLFQAQKAVEKLSGAPIPENIDGYLAAGLFQTKTSAAMKRYQDQTVASLLSDVKKVLRQTGATQKDLDDYLKAKHAPERNRVMAEKFPDRWSDAPGSGMSNADAASIVSQAQSKGWEDGFERVAKKVYTLLRVDVANRVEAGLLAPETAAEWAKMYPDGRYVPLRGFAERDPDDPEAQVGRMNSGKGFDIRGKESREARGRSSDADSPIAYAIMMGAEGIVRISKNKVAKTLYRFAKEHPTDAVRPLGKMPTRAATDLKTGNTAIVINSEALNSPNIMAAKIGGKPYYMELSPELAVGMKNLGADQLGGLSQMARKLTRYWSSMLTSRNPAFFIPNATVDFMTGILTSLQADAPRGFARRYVTGYAGALTALWQWNTGAPISAKWKQRISEWEEDGGRMDFYGYQNLDDIKEELGKAARETRSGRLKRGVKGALPAAFSAVEWLNTPFENAARFSAYNAARDLGVSRAKAAMHSLESTGNFTKRGEMTPLIGAWWPFFNASMTGLDQIASYGKHPATQAVLAGSVMMPMIWGLVAASMFPDDDDPEGVPLYFRIPEYERSKAIIIPRGVIEEEIENPDGSTRMVRRLDFSMIRIPHALRPFWTLGDQIAAAYYGGVSVGEIVSKTLVSALTNWNPISGSDPVSMMLPLVGDPIYELSTNRDGLGRAIRPEGFGGATEGVPAYSWHETKTSPVFIEAAQAMNDATGGDSVRPGMVSVHPDHLEYLWEFMTGGLGRFASEVAQTTQNAIEGVETPPSRIPILRTSMGRTDGRIQTDRFYDMLNEGEAMADALNSTKTKVRMGELGEAEWQQVLDLGAELGVDVGSPTSKNKWDGSWLNVLRKAQKAANGVRDEIRATKARTDISRAEVEAEVIRLQGRREAIMIAARTRALEIRAKQPER